MRIDSVDNMKGCHKCDYTGKVSIEGDDREHACSCVQWRADRMRHYEPLLRKCDLHSYSGMTFDRFEPNHDAQTFALRQMTNVLGGFYLFGPVGVGKTHLAVAMVYALRDKNVPAVIFTVQEALALMSPHTKEADIIKDLLMSVPYLVIDDLGREDQGRWAKQKMFELMNKRWRLSRLFKPCYTTITSQIEYDRLIEHYDKATEDRILPMTMAICVQGLPMRQVKGQVAFHNEEQEVKAGG